METNARGGDGRGKERRIGLRTARARVTADRARINWKIVRDAVGSERARRRVEALSIERVYAERLVAIAAEIGGLVD